MKLLIVEDKTALRENIENNFTEESSICEGCTDLKSALQKIALYNYDCILLDINLPDGEDFAILEFLKIKDRNECVLIISARNSLNDKLKGLNIGADDYITKPFHREKSGLLWQAGSCCFKIPMIIIRSGKSLYLSVLQRPVIRRDWFGFGHNQKYLFQNTNINWPISL